MDSFTKLPNLFGLIETEGDSVSGLKGSAVLLDIDGLHRINQEYGREVGDSCIFALVRSFKDALLSEGGRAYRLGGDEFLLLLPGMEKERAEELSRAITADFSDYCAESSVRSRVVDMPQEASSLGSLLVTALLSFEKDRQDVIRSADVVPLLDRLVKMAGESITLLREAWEAALTDVTTGLPNSRAVEEALTQQIKEYQENGQPFSILLADGDHLKRYNEELGYGEGNRMISRLGKLVAEQVHPSGFVGRWLMGDEFMVILKDTPRAKAALTAERIRRAVAEHSEAWPIAVTVSIGVVGCPENGQDLDGLVHAAEAANLLAKKDGKNRVK